MDKVYVGAAYYPELWDLSEVDKDIERMHAAGVNVARIGEFAWSRMEPKEGEFDFSWLHEVVDKLYAAGIDSILCTPSCTPPRWLFKKYPETISVDFNDRRAEISSRCHPCKTSPVMREKNRIITEQLAKEFGSHPGVIGWQIDNEIFPYGEGCYCPLCKSAFRTYLKEKYGTPEKLNKAWGMYRWSLNYDSFDDVDPPRPGQWKHPSLETEWRRFQCKQIVSYVEEQADVLHAYSKAPVGTDMMVTNLLSYYETNKKLDVIQYNHYEPAKLLPDTKFSFDFLRPILPRPFWVTETQVGWNGGNVAFFGYRPEGNCYVNTWMPIALGGEMNEYWLFRAHPQGHELAHGSLYSTPGRAYRVTEEVKHAADDFATCADFLKKSKVVSKIAMHYSSTAVSHFISAPMLEGFDYRRTLVQNFHAAFRDTNIDVIDTQHSLDGYEVILSPFLATVDENGLKERVIDWVKAGGTWIVGPMSDIFDENTCKYVNAPYSFVEELAGVYVKYQKPVANDVFKARFEDGADCPVSMCYDAFEAKDCKTLASYDGDEFDGLAVITERKVGEGRVILLGSVPSKEALRKLAGVSPVAKASENIVLVERSGEENGIIALETEHKEGALTLDGTYTDLLTGEKMTGTVKVAPHRVLVLKKA